MARHTPRIGESSNDVAVELGVDGGGLDGLLRHRVRIDRQRWGVPRDKHQPVNLPLPAEIGNICIQILQMGAQNSNQ